MMKALTVQQSEMVRARISLEHIKDRAIENINSLYRKVKEISETEDMVVVLWAILMVCLSYTAYIRFSECGKIIGLYVQNRF